MVRRRSPHSGDKARGVGHKAARRQRQLLAANRLTAAQPQRRHNTPLQTLKSPDKNAADGSRIRTAAQCHRAAYGGSDGAGCCRATAPFREWPGRMPQVWCGAPSSPSSCEMPAPAFIAGAREFIRQRLTHVNAQADRMRKLPWSKQEKSNAYLAVCRHGAVHCRRCRSCDPGGICRDHAQVGNRARLHGVSQHPAAFQTGRRPAPPSHRLGATSPSSTGMTPARRSGSHAPS